MSHTKMRMNEWINMLCVCLICCCCCGGGLPCEGADEIWWIPRWRRERLSWHEAEWSHPPWPDAICSVSIGCHPSSFRRASIRIRTVCGRFRLPTPISTWRRYATDESPAPTISPVTVHQINQKQNDKAKKKKNKKTTLTTTFCIKDEKQTS
jgi:hypothetical protein